MLRRLEVGRSAARAEPLHPDRPGGTPRLINRRSPTPRTRPSRRRRTSWPVDDSGASSVAVRRPAAAGRRRSRERATTSHPARRARRRTAARPAFATTRDSCSRSARPDARACRSIATSGTTPVPPADAERRASAVPDEPAADRSAHLELVAGLDDVGEVGRHLAVVEPLDVQLEQRVIGAEATE